MADTKLRAEIRNFLLVLMYERDQDTFQVRSRFCSCRVCLTNDLFVHGRS